MGVAIEDVDEAVEGAAGSKTGGAVDWADFEAQGHPDGCGGGLRGLLAGEGGHVDEAFAAGATVEDDVDVGDVHFAGAGGDNREASDRVTELGGGGDRIEALLGFGIEGGAGRRGRRRWERRL